MSIDPQRRQERHRRIRITKRLLRPLPRRATLHRYPILKWFAEAARRRPYLWTFRVSAMTPALYVGSVLTLLPIVGIQIPLAFLAALALRANLPVLIGLQLLTNVFTAAPIFLFTYHVGNYIADIVGIHGPDVRGGPAATKLIIGGVLCGVILGAVLDLIYRFLAYEAQKHHWHLPRRKPPQQEEIASPAPPPDAKE